MIEAAPRRERLHLWLLFLVASFAYGLYAVAKHARFMTGFDLGLFDQHLWRSSHLLPLANTLRELPHLWGDHFHPLFLILTPLYWVGDGTSNLLWAQALLVCAGAFPLYRYARRKIEHVPTLLLVSGFLVAWPVGEGLGFDVHDIALTVPALGWAILLFEERRFRPFWIAAAALLLTREDQGLTVAAFGVLALFRREWVLGSGLIVVGMGWFLVAMKWIIPHFAGGAFAHWGYGHIAPDAASLVIVLLTHPKLLVQNLILPFTKVALVRRFLEPCLFLGLASPLIVLAIPGLLSRVLSQHAKHWDPTMHWGMPTALIVAFATVDVFGRGLILVRRVNRAKVARFGATALLLASLIGAALVPQKSLFRPSFWRDDAQRSAGRRAIALVPPEARVVASNIALPHLSRRREIFADWGYFRDYPPTWRAPRRLSSEEKIESYRRGDVIVFDATSPNPEGVAILGRMPEFERVFNEEGWIVFRRRE